MGLCFAPGGKGATFAILRAEQDQLEGKREGGRPRCHSMCTLHFFFWKEDALYCTLNPRSETIPKTPIPKTKSSIFRTRGPLGMKVSASKMEKLPVGRASSSREPLHLAVKEQWRMVPLPVQAWALLTASTVERTFSMEPSFLSRQPYHHFLPQQRRKYKASALISLNGGSLLPNWESLVFLSFSWCQHLPYLTSFVLTSCLFIHTLFLPLPSALFWLSARC